MSERERDRSIEELLRRHLGTSAEPGPADACLDADVVAAWLDGALSPNEVAAAEAHAASCARCQALLAAVVRTEPARPVPESQWSWIHALRWAVPVTAAAGAVAIWIAVTPREPSQPTSPKEVAERAAPTAPSEPTPAPPPAADQPPLETAANAKRSRLADSVADTDRREAVSAGPAKKELADRGGARLDVPNQTLDSLSAKSMSPAASPVPPAPSPVPPAISSRDAAPLLPPAAAASASPQEPLRTPTAPPVTPPLVQPTEGAADARAGVSARERSIAGKPTGLAESVTAAGRGGGARAVAFTGPVEVASPDPLYRWRTRSPGAIDRSVDGGRTWEAQQIGVAGVVTSGSAPSPSVCWLAGRGGYVVVSTDGRTWRRRAFPEAVDLIDIRAADAATAIVTTIDGRRFGTTDGGSTWTPR